MGFLSKAWKGIKNGFKKIGKAIKSGFQKFGKFMGRFGMLGSLAMSMLLPGIGGTLLKGLGNNVFNLGLKTAAGQTGVTFSQFTNALIGKGGSRAALGHTLNFGGSLVSKVSAPIRSVTEGITTLLKTGANAVGINVFEPIAKTIGIDNYDGQFFTKGLGEAAQQGQYFGKDGGFASAYDNSKKIIKTAYGPNIEADVQYDEEGRERFAIKPGEEGFIPESTVTASQAEFKDMTTLGDSAPPDLSLNIAGPVETPVARRSLMDRAVNYFGDVGDRAKTEFQEFPEDVIDSFAESVGTTLKDAAFGKEDEAIEKIRNTMQIDTGERTRAESLAAADVENIGVIQQYTGDNPHDTNTFFIQTPVYKNRLTAFAAQPTYALS